MRKFVTIIASLFLSVNTFAQQLAFPEAQGWGRFATGGRKGTVYHVTNLNDSGPGSLRDAVTTKNRIVVFDVAGVINLSSCLVFASDLYVAGQSAPGEGITVYGNRVSFSGSNNSIIRYMRFRMGAGGDKDKDCAGVANGTNMIFDHCSFAWGRDETFSINPDGKGDTHSITLQNCVVGQGLMSHSAGGLMQADKITLYRNFYCDNSTRNNKVKGINQYVNNLVYNWKDGAYIMGGDSEGQSYCNIVGNLFINGPVGDGNAFTVGNANFHCYVKDNIQDKNKNGVFDPSDVTEYSSADLVAKPYDYPELETISASQVIGILNNVGASYPSRDYVDCYMVDECRSYGKKGALISNEGSLPYGTPNTWNVWKGNERADSDNDGIPDKWEEHIGSDPQKNDAMALRSDGYTNIEYYLNNITKAEEDVEFLRAPQLVEQTSVNTVSMTIGWRDWTDNELGFIIEAKTGNEDFTEVGRVEKDVTSFIYKGLKPGSAYTIRIRAWAYKNHTEGSEIIYSEYTEAQTYKTNPEVQGIVNVDSYEPDATWTNNKLRWSFSDKAWDTEDGLYKDGMKVLLVPTDIPSTITITENVAPGCIVVQTQGENAGIDIVSDTGIITGATSMNKAGEGVLNITGNHTYTGATVVNEGTYTFYSLANGGQPSGIGASEEFAQNWVFNGGTFCYDGKNTKTATTNRGAKVTKNSTFKTSGSSTKVIFNGIFEGGKDLTFSGQGTVQPNTTKFFGYTGATILEGGTLYLPSAEMSNNGIGSSSKLIFSGGKLSTKGESEGYETYSFPIEVTEGTKSTFAPNRNCYIKNKFTGSGTLQIDIPYVREYIQGNFDNFYGRIIANAVNSGNLFLMNGKNIPNGVVELRNGARCVGWDTNGNYTLGGLAGVSGTELGGSSKKDDSFTCTWTVGTANTNETFRGVINNYSCSGSGHQGKVNIIKAGTGVWRLTGANEYSGTTTVNAGTLTVNGTHSGTGTVTVNKNATLSGIGTLAGAVTIASNGTIHAGDTTLVNKKTLTVKGKLTVQKGGIVSIPVSYTSSARANSLGINGGATLTNATLSLEGLEDAGDIPEDTEFKVLTISGTITGTFAKILPSIPCAGKIWDTSDLTTKGILRVKADESSAIHSIDNIDKGASKAFDLTGRKIEDGQLTSGLYIINGKKIKK